MRKRNLVTLIAAMLLMFVLAFTTACARNGNDNEGGTTQPPQNVPAPPPAPPGNGAADPAPAPEPDVPVRDLGGLEIVLGNWWGYYDTDTFEPATEAAEIRLLDRIYVQERYNFRLREVRMGGWGEVRDMIPIEIAAGSRDVHIWIAQPDWFATMHAQNMFHPLSDDYFRHDDGITWNRSAIDATRRNGIPYGWATGIVEGGGIYFNMRLLEEAGIDPHEPFNLQMAGNWTWDTFTDLLIRTTRDTDGDGIPDTFGMTNFSVDILERAIASNGATWIDQQGGQWVNATQRPEFLEAHNFVNTLYDLGVILPQPEGAAWDAFIPSFNNGEAAFRSAGGYVAGAQINPNLDDPWGFVAFPRGPRSDRHYFFGNANVHAIPINFTAEEVDDIMFALLQWIRHIPELDDPDGWMAGAFTNHYSERSVTETMALFTRDTANHRPLLHGFVPGRVPGLAGELFAWPMWQGTDSAYIIENAQPIWTEYIARGNEGG